MMDLSFDGKVAVVTGGSSGIGLGVAKRLAAEGAEVLICARRAEVLAAAAEGIRADTGKTVATVSTDVARPDQIDALRDEVITRFGRVDVLINNAGTGTYKPFLEVTDDELIDGMALNFFSQFRVSQRLVPLMRDGSGGSIVNVSGCSGLMVLEPPFFSTCTGPAKAAEIRFTKALAAEVGAWNIRVNCVAPNFVVTPERFERWRTTINKNPDAQAEDLQSEWGARIALPGKRWCTIEEAVNTILFVASSAASYMTGSVIVVDGGYDRG